MLLEQYYTLITNKPAERGLVCRRWESNPHGRKAHCALNAARLPIPPLRLDGGILPQGFHLSTFCVALDLLGFSEYNFSGNENHFQIYRREHYPSSLRFCILLAMTLSGSVYAEHKCGL